MVWIARRWWWVADSDVHERWIEMLARRAVSTEAMRTLLDDGKWWTDREGRTHVIATMERRHAANVVRLFERRAVTLHDGECAMMALLPAPHGEQAGWDFGDEVSRLHETDPLEWLRERPLIRALIERADGHPGGPSASWRLRHPVGTIARIVRRAR